ncbi:MAG: reverse transcriptase domain-containing protein [Paraclostridium sp.]
MNYLVLYKKNGEAVNFPLIKKIQSLPLVVSEVLGIDYSEIERATVFYNGSEKDFKYSLYQKAFRENIENKVSIKDMLSLVKMDSFRFVELLRNSIVTSNFTKFIATRYKNSKSNIGKIDKIERFVSFDEELITKKNGKKKIRYFCKPRYSFKPMFRDLKTLLTSIVKLEDEMLGAGKGLIESKKYFENFETMVKIDFKDFFNQVSYAKFYSGLKDECGDFLTENAMKSIAMNVCPYSRDKKKRATYQGLPTSTIASYIAIKPLFKEIKKELAKYGTEPVIYIDDLCFKAKDKEEAFMLKKLVLDIIKKYRFVVNGEKCKVLYGNKCFFLGINMKTKSMPKKYIDTIKAGLNNYFHGDDEYREATKSVTQGRLEYVKYISEEQFNKLNSHPKYSMFINCLYNA